MVKYLEVQLNINQMLEGNINQHNRVRLKNDFLILDIDRARKVDI